MERDTRRLADPEPAAPPPGLTTGMLRVFDLAVGQMLWSRRTIFMALVVGLPVAVALVVRVLVEAGVPLTRVGRETVDGTVLFGLMMWAFFVRFAVPLLAMFYGTSLIADEVEDRTLTYLFTRPVRREAVYLGKFLAFVVATAAVVVPAVVLVWLFVAPIGGHLGETFPDLAADLGVIMAGLFGYGAFFGLVGATLKRPLVVGLLFVFGWETLAMALPGYLKRLTVAHYVQGLVPHAMPADSPVALIQALFREAPALTESLVGLGVIVIVGLSLAARIVARREYVLEQ